MERRSAETSITCRVQLGVPGSSDVNTGVGFLDHMVCAMAKHGGMRIELSCEGDLHVDDHHTVEDTGIALGQALTAALGDKKGINRYGECHLAMDDAQVRCALDLSARPYLIWNVTFEAQKIGAFDTELVREFFQGFSTHGGITLHVDQIHGFNAHHVAEAAFKSVARALRTAVETDPRKADAIPSTKGAL